MKHNFIKKFVTLSLINATLLITLPVSASAEWKEDSKGWWYSEGNSWATGWRNINDKWYYFDNNGYMVKNTTINGYNIDNNGVWVQNTNVATTNNSNNTTNLNSNNVTSTNLTTNSNNMINSNNLTNVTNNINNGVIINGNVNIGNTTNSNSTKQSNNDNYNTQINSNNYNKTEPIIEGKFTDKENSLFPCWTIIGGKYYHLDKDKQVDYNTNIDGYEIGADGAWIQDNSITPPNAIVLPYGFQLNAEQTIGKLQMDAKNNEIRQDLKSEKHNSRMSKIKELQDKIENIKKNHLNNGDYWIQIYQNQIKELQLKDEENS